MTRCRLPSCLPIFQECDARTTGARHFQASWASARAASSMRSARTSAAPACREIPNALRPGAPAGCPSEYVEMQKPPRVNPAARVPLSRSAASRTARQYIRGRAKRSLWRIDPLCSAGTRCTIPKWVRTEACARLVEKQAHGEEMTGRSPDRGTRTPLVIEDRPAAPRDPGDAADLSIPWGKRANEPSAKRRSARTNHCGDSCGKATVIATLAARRLHEWLRTPQSSEPVGPGAFRRRQGTP